MRAEDHIHQARAFLDWYERVGGDFGSAFLMWARTKDFMPTDKRAILLLVRQWRTGAWRALIETPASAKADELVVCVED